MAEISYRPGKCKQDYRVVIVHKRIREEEGSLFQGMRDRYFFYITNIPGTPPEQIVFRANDRCDQENIIEQLKNGARALTAPVDNLVSNGAYMVMASLAWCLKSWMALWLPEPPGRWKADRQAEKRAVLRMEFKRFVNAFVAMPAQIVRRGRQLVFRLLSWNPWQTVFFRLYESLRC